MLLPSTLSSFTKGRGSLTLMSPISTAQTVELRVGGFQGLRTKRLEVVDWLESTSSLV